MPDVMISYARKDAKDFAEYIASELRRHHIDAWLDTYDIEGGAQWLQAIETALDTCAIILAVRTPGGKESQWVRRERLYALDKHKKIIPLLLMDCPNDLELIGYQPVDFRHEFDSAFEELLKLIESLHKGVRSTLDRRTLEQAYLGKLLLEFSLWQDLYTPMAGVAHFRADENKSAAIQTRPAFIDPQFAAMFDKGKDQPDRELKHETYDDIIPAIEKLRQVVILGDPGSGKTTTLWRIASEYAKRANADAEQPLPVFVRLGELDGDQTIEGHIKQQLGNLAPYYDELLDEKRLAFLLDGLNELPTNQRDQQIEALRMLVKHCQQQGMVVTVTCRELDYTPALDMKIDERVEVTPLDPVRIRDFVSRYIKEPPGKGNELFWQLAGEEAREYWEDFQKEVNEPAEVFWVVDALPEGKEWWRWDYWLKERNQSRSMVSLASNPYMLYMITQVFTLQGGIPQNRGLLFQKFVDFLLTKREKLPENAAEQLKRRLAKLAYAMQMVGEGTSFSRQSTLDVLSDIETDGEQKLYQAHSANLLSGTKVIRFTHQLLQEYFAALCLDHERKKGKKAVEIWKPENWWEPTVWEETAILLAGFYSEDCSFIIDWLKEAQPELAARCILESGAEIAPETYEGLRDAWLPRMTDLQRNPDPRARAAVGRAMGSLDFDTLTHQHQRHILDNRPGVGIVIRNGVRLPDIVWCEVPGGEFIFGAGIEQQRLHLDTFYIARYPVTYAQFQTFADSPDFGNERWWKGAPKVKEDGSSIYELSEQFFKYANHPRDSVSWYQAEAFCLWLSDKLGYKISLPSSQQWERAARGNVGLIYPYGNKFDPSKDNAHETGINQTSAVGIFPNGASPEGVLDMSGNVSEWSSDWYVFTDFDYVNACVVRGYGRADEFQGNMPNHLDKRYGFRVVCSFPLDR